MTPEKKRELVRECLRKRRIRLKAAGICQDCGKVPAKSNRHTLCAVCIDYRSKRQWIRAGFHRESTDHVERLLRLAGL